MEYKTLREMYEDKMGHSVLQGVAELGALLEALEYPALVQSTKPLSPQDENNRLDNDVRRYEQEGK